MFFRCSKVNNLHVHESRNPVIHTANKHKSTEHRTAIVLGPSQPLPNNPVTAA